MPEYVVHLRRSYEALHVVEAATAEEAAQLAQEFPPGREAWDLDATIVAGVRPLEPA